MSGPARKRRAVMAAVVALGVAAAIGFSELTTTTSNAGAAFAFALVLGPSLAYLASSVARRRWLDAVWATVLGGVAFAVFVVYLTVQVVGTMSVAWWDSANAR